MTKLRPVIFRFLYVLLWIGIIVTFIVYFTAFPIIYILSGVLPRDILEAFAVIEKRYFNSI